MAASAAVLSAVIEHAGLGIALVGLDGITFQVNPAFCRMLGYTDEELLAMTFSQITHPDDVEQDEGLFAELLAGLRDLYRSEKRYVRKDGNVRSLVTSGSRSPAWPVGSRLLTDRTASATVRVVTARTVLLRR